MALCYRENYKEGAKQLDIQAGLIEKTPFHLTYVNPRQSLILKILLLDSGIPCQ